MLKMDLALIHNAMDAHEKRAILGCAHQPCTPTSPVRGEPDAENPPVHAGKLLAK
ncbi:hypothetical protein [Comamonas aquatica]|uniref:hypothetical protein n=1 Tax=Comamonas aquatica TaxID=225991 RepID=UPI001E56FA9C|nr:hypothetical protein [Comamonas aquatica]